MAFIELCASTSRGRGVRGRPSDTEVTTMSLTKSGVFNDAQRYNLSIRLSQDLVKQMRWQFGDRIKVMADDAKPHRLLLLRVTSGGWALSHGGGKGQDNKKLRIQISSHPDVKVAPGERYQCVGFSEEHGGAVLDFVKASA